MTNALDMSLDELIKHNKGMGRGGGRGRRGAFNHRGYIGPKMTRPFRRQMNWAIARQTPYATTTKAPDNAWQRNIYENVTEILPPPIRPIDIETGTKLYISNLDYGVSKDDIKELFSEAGDVKRCSVHYDRSGRSKGTAEVVFSRKVDGVAALKWYNNVQLDGKAMKIELIGTNLITPALPHVATVAIQPRPMLQVNNGATNGLYSGHEVIGLSNPGQGRMFGRSGGTRGRSFFGGRWGYRGRGRGRGRNRGRGRGGAQGRNPTVASKSAADLDAELETYHSEAMQT